MNTPDCTTKRILLVEDEPSIGNMCQRVLTREGFQVEIAINGAVAQEMLQRRQYDLCLIDMRTPKMGGEELYQWLQTEYPQTASHVIFTTGSVIDDRITAFLQQSGRPFLPKPFTPNELIAIVNESLKHPKR